MCKSVEMIVVVTAEKYYVFLTTSFTWGFPQVFLYISPKFKSLLQWRNRSPLPCSGQSRLLLLRGSPILEVTVKLGSTCKHSHHSRVHLIWACASRQIKEKTFSHCIVSFIGSHRYSRRRFKPLDWFTPQNKDTNTQMSSTKCYFPFLCLWTLSGHIIVLSQ